MLFRRQHQTQTVGGSHLAFPGGGRMGHIWQGPVVGHSLAEDYLCSGRERERERERKRHLGTVQVLYAHSLLMLVQ